LTYISHEQTCESSEFAFGCNDCDDLAPTSKLEKVPFVGERKEERERELIEIMRRNLP
jgi:hypothetical protein